MWVSAQAMFLNSFPIGCGLRGKNVQPGHRVFVQAIMDSSMQSSVPGEYLVAVSSLKADTS